MYLRNEDNKKNGNKEKNKGNEWIWIHFFYSAVNNFVLFPEVILLLDVVFVRRRRESFAFFFLRKA